MASRGKVWSVQRVLYPGGGLGASWFRPSRIGQLGGAFWAASWSQFSGVDVELGCVLCQWVYARVQ
jgi:hypothetical protein